jgi:acyl dehydratase
MGIVYFEDIEVGQKWVKSITYQVKKEEIIEFASRWDPRYFHVDPKAAVSSVFGGLVACSAHIFSILSWFGTHGERRTASMAALGFDDLHMRRAVRPDDILSCSFVYLEKRESKSKPDRGIVRTSASLSNQQNIEVFSAVITSMVAKRPQSHLPLQKK